MNNQKDIFFRIFHSIDFEKIKDHPNILIAANFWEEERFQAARTCYKFMRSLDDLIDNYKAEHKIITDVERNILIKNAENWIHSIRSTGNDNSGQHELNEMVKRYNIPLWPMEDFVKSMIYDINHNGFKSIPSFIDYSQGASVAPASIFVHLTGLQRNGNEYIPPAFDVREVSSPCALFSYFVHIIRDFVKDQLNNLNYFAEDIMLKNNLNGEKLSDMAKGAELSDGFREMMKEYYMIADEYRIKTEKMLKVICPLLEPRYQLSLKIIFDLYLMVFERIDVEHGNFSTPELNPTSSETRERVYSKILEFFHN